MGSPGERAEGTVRFGGNTQRGSEEPSGRAWGWGQAAGGDSRAHSAPGADPAGGSRFPERDGDTPAEPAGHLLVTLRSAAPQSTWRPGEATGARQGKPCVSQSPYSWVRLAPRIGGPPLD